MDSRFKPSTNSRGINGFDPRKRDILDSKTWAGERRKRESAKEQEKEKGEEEHRRGKIVKRAVLTSVLGYLRI